MSEEYQSPFLDNRERLLENEVGFVICDAFPVSEGHCLIIPKRICPDYFVKSKIRYALYIHPS